MLSIKQQKQTTKIVSKLNKSKDVSTLGELDGLAQLKAKMEAENRKSAEAKLSKKEEEAPKS